MKVVILGGGIIGLAIAVELRLLGVAVTVLDRGLVPRRLGGGGMIVPQAEGLDSAMAGLGLLSRSLWPAWAHRLEGLTGVSVGYNPCGVLLPGLPEAATPTEGPHERGRVVDPAQVAAAVPGIAPEVEGGLWLEKEGCADNRKLLVALRRAAVQSGVECVDGIHVLGPADDRLNAVATDRGPVTGDIFVLAQGAWSGTWLELPVTPLKGQMLALQTEPGWLKTVVFGEQVYLVPREEGRIVVGATQEPVGFEPGNTVAGIAHLLTGALALVPGLASFQLVEQWWGYRPATPDQAPLLGRGPWPHLYLATGHHRNGILLAPATAQLLAREIVFAEEQPLLEAFSYRRFGRPDSSHPRW